MALRAQVRLVRVDEELCGWAEGSGDHRREGQIGGGLIEVRDLEAAGIVPVWTWSLAQTMRMNDGHDECGASSERQKKHQAAGDQAATSAHPRSPNCYPSGSYASFRLFGSRSSCFGRSIRCRDRMISMSFLRPLGAPFIIAPTRRSSFTNSLRHTFSPTPYLRTDPTPTCT